jgi:transmembrane sensor
MTRPAPEGIEPPVALRAAQGFLLLQSGEATESERAHWSHWRAAHPMHELAWQRAERVAVKFDLLPRALAVPALGRPLRTHRRAAFKALAVLLGAAPATWLAWRMAPAAEWLADHRTATGERRALSLSDGTRLQLNTATAVDVAYDVHQRLVRLRAGEIVVDTAPDAVPTGAPGHRPFVVETAHGRLRALGTRFVVRQLDGERSHLAVLHGAVEVQPREAAARAVVLDAGQQISFDARSVGDVTAAGADADDWSRGILHARNLRLHDFAAELARYRPGVLRCDPAVADLRISGVFQLKDTGSVLDSLPQALPVDVLYRTRYWVSIVPPGG